MNAILWSAAGTGFTFLMTVAGAAVVFLFRGTIRESVQRACLGFAAGVMLAASVWSLLLPAIDQAEQTGGIKWLPPLGGIFLGGIFLCGMDWRLGRRKRSAGELRTGLLFTAVTLHNIPEGMAVGMAFAMAAQQNNGSVVTPAAIGLALGIGIQNFPEGAALSLPFRQEGMSRIKAFLLGGVSGIVEPLAGIAVTFICGQAAAVMPWLLSFAAGAMIYVVAEELIPEARPGCACGEGKRWAFPAGTAWLLVGFALMMVLDVALSG